MKIKIQLPVKSPLFEAASGIVKVLRSHSKKAFFAGGCVRDMILGRAPHDIDITTSATPAEIEAMFPKTIALGVSFGVITILQDGFAFETATLREEREYMDGRRPETVLYTDDEKLDVQRRDFTINGMLYDPLASEILDYVGGMEDLHRGIIRTIGDPAQRFSEDYLRILRAVRFSARFGFPIEPETEKMMAKYAEKLSLLSKERIRDEVEKMLLGPRASDAFRLMLKTGILKTVLPEIAALDGVRQDSRFHPEGDVFTHTMLMLDKMCHPTKELAWSVLLHDVGKPAAFTEDERGIHFYSHEKIGGEMAEDILTRLRCPAALIRNVSMIVANHMKFASVDRMRRATWLKMMDSPTFASEMELNRVDCASCHCKMDGYILMLDRYLELADAPAVPPLPVNGHDLVELGIPPGKGIGDLLSLLKDEFLENRLKTREEMLEFVRKKMRNQ